MEFIRRSTEQDLVQLFQLYDSLMEQRQELENRLDDAEDTRLPLVLSPHWLSSLFPCIQSSTPLYCSSVYLSPRDRQILDWHFANLEFANASPLHTLSLRHWDQDDDFEFTGAHLCLRDGYDALPKALAKGLDVRLNTSATSIHYSPDGNP